MSVTVYLAGPINGLTPIEATAWRDAMKLMLANRGLAGVSPMDVAAVGLQTAVNTDSFLTDDEREKIHRFCLREIDKASGVVAKFPPLTEPGQGFGTLFELGYAMARQLPVVIIDPMGITTYSQMLIDIPRAHGELSACGMIHRAIEDAARRSAPDVPITYTWASTAADMRGPQP